MKRFYKFLFFTTLPVVLLLMASSGGSPGGKTGSNGDGGNNCTQCHSGTATTVQGWITTDIPANGYVGGQTYTITATGTHTGVGKFGFELTSEDMNGNKVGTWIITNAAQTKLTNNNKAVTHTSGGTTPSGNSKTWSVNWTAPSSLVGAVKFWAAFNAANGNGGTSGDVIYLSSAQVLPQPEGAEITFRVDMSEQTPSPLGIHIAGSFQGWDPAGTEMFPVGNGIYEVVVLLNPGETVEYKFVNGNAWGMDEQVPAGCAQNNNRFLTVPNQNTTLEAVCFGSCTVCNPPTVDITFQVDMSNETVSPLGVHIAGSFQGWDPAGTEMLSVGDNVYAVTLALEAGNYYEYKFVNGNAWGMDETVPPQCAAGWNRYITVPAVPTTLDAVCFGSCYPCGPPPVDVEITFQVDMSEQVISPDGVHIAGGFQGWDPGATLMTDAGNGLYTYTGIFPSGTYQEYKFVNGNEWTESENVPAECGYNNNRYFTVPQTNTVFDPVCYGACGPCGPPPVDINVTFQVDMSNEEVSPDGVHLAGTFQGWSSNATPMSHIGDNIYQVTVVLQSSANHQYKYINGASFDFVEIVPEACGVPDGQGGFNRYLTVPQADTTMIPLCFSSCELCVPPLPDHAVTFRVDMTYETVSPDGVHLAGNFQGWNPGLTPMTNTSGNIYEVTVLLEEASAIEYKFINGNTFEFAEIVPIDCSQNANRFLTVPTADTTLTAVCFSSCEPCGTPPVFVNVTFKVDMMFETVAPEGVHIAGSFQGWNPGSTLMTAAGDDVYEYTTALESGSFIEYKFINGNQWSQIESIPAACAYNNNRYLTIPDVDIILEEVCFGSCDTCSNVGLTEFSDAQVVVYPNPATQTIFIRSEYKILSVELFTPDGIHFPLPASTYTDFDVSGIRRGLYFIKTETLEGIRIQKLVLQ